MLLVLSVHVVAVMGNNHGRPVRALPFRAQHGGRHRAPDGEQDGKQDQDDDAEAFHVA